MEWKLPWYPAETGSKGCISNSEMPRAGRGLSLLCCSAPHIVLSRHGRGESPRVEKVLQVLGPLPSSVLHWRGLGEGSSCDFT